MSPKGNKNKDRKVQKKKIRKAIIQGIILVFVIAFVNFLTFNFC